MSRIPTLSLWTLIVFLQPVIAGCGSESDADDPLAPSSSQTDSESWADSADGDENPNCYGQPRENPFVFFGAELGFLSDLKAQRRLLDCLDRDAVHLSYRLRLVWPDVDTSVHCEIDLARDGDLVKQTGTIEKDGKPIEFELDATTARWTVANGASREEPRGDALMLAEIEGLDPETRMTMLHNEMQPGVGVMSAVSAQLLGTPDAWTFTGEGDSVRAVLPRTSLSQFDPDTVVESANLLLSDGAVPLECRTRFVGKDYSWDFEMTIQ